MIGGWQPLWGRRPGDRRVRIDRPEARSFRYAGKDVLRARPAAIEPTTTTGRFIASVRHTFFGRPLASDEEGEQRLSKKKALAIFSSDVISSSD